MNRICLYISLLLIVLFLLPAVIGAEESGSDSKGATAYREVPVEFSLYSPVEIFRDPRKRVNGFQLSLIYGNTFAFRGFSTGLIHAVDEDMTGFQLNLSNIVKGTARGVQAGLINRGAAFNGMQAAIINITTPSSRGFQLGLINMSTAFLEENNTFLEADTLKGLQLGIFNISDNINGVQVGFINVADSVRGLQLGLINISDSVEGIPIGLINIYTEGAWDISSYFSLNTLLNIAVRSRGKLSYGIFMLGYDPRSDRSLDRASLGFGFGFHLEIGLFHIDTDLTYHLTSKGFNDDLFNHDSGTNSGYGTIKLRLLPGWQIINRISIFAGPVCNIYPPINRDFGYRFDFNAGITITIF